MTDEPDAQPPAQGESGERERAPRYCATCGEIFAEPLVRCPQCGAAWPQPSRLGVEPLASLLTEFRGLRDNGVLTHDGYEALRRTYERRLLAVRPARRAATAPEPSLLPAQTWPADATGTPPTAMAGRPQPAATVHVEATPLPPRRPSLAEWTARRQADILLYLGAFLLSIAALIFVDYQGAAVGGSVRFGILLAYTAGFLGLGLVLPRWARVREAGAVFLALGAVLTPVNFLALRTLVLGSDAPADVVLFAGCAVTAGLYLALAARGFGRWYALPGALAAATGWGATGSVLNLPAAWFGAWYVGGVAAAYHTALWARLPGMRAVAAGAALIGAGGLLFGHVVAALSGSSEAAAQLPIAYALATAGVAGAYARRRDVEALALLPALAALTAATAWWSVFGFGPAWTGAVVALAAGGYLAAAQIDRDERTRSWHMAAAGAAALGLLLVHTSVTESGAGRAALPATYALTLAWACAAFARWRMRGALATVPALAAATGAAAAWALQSASVEWLACWIAAAGLGYLLVAERDTAFRSAWRAGAVAAGALALTWAHTRALTPGTPAAQLPLTYVMALAGALWDSARRRDAGMLAVPPLAAMLAAASLWAAGAGPEWWIYPGLAASVLIVAAEPWWRQRAELRAAGWPLALVPALALPLLWLPVHDGLPAHGLTVHLTVAGLFLIGGLRARRAMAWRVEHGQWDETTALVTRALLWTSAAFTLSAAGRLNDWAGAAGADRAWVFAALGTLAWLGLAIAAGVRRDLLSILAPPAIATMLIAAFIAADDPAVATVVLALGTAGPLAVAVLGRRWLPAGIATPFGAAGLAFAWEWRALDPAMLPLAYAAVAAVLWAGLATRRDYARGERGVVVTVLSWGPWALALAAAYLVVTGRQSGLASGSSIVATREWATLTLTLALAAAVVTLDGLRLGRAQVTVAGSGGLLLAALCAIALIQPANAQAYTVPVGLYLLALGLVWQRSAATAGGNMEAHEAVTVLGLAFLVLPPAQQSFGAGGGIYGLQLILLGLLFLAVGVVLSARWFVAGGVLTLSGVAVRWLLIFGAGAPYWLTLGLVGTALLGVGMALLLERERWDSVRERIAGWWQGAPTGPGARRGA